MGKEGEQSAMHFAFDATDEGNSDTDIACNVAHPKVQ